MREKQYVRVDEHGVMRVGTTRVMLDALVAGFEQGHSPETIQQQFPALSLEEVYGAITYYLSHRDDVQAYLQRQEALWKALRVEAEKQASPVVKRLRALRDADVPDVSCVGHDFLPIMTSTSTWCGVLDVASQPSSSSALVISACTSARMPKYSHTPPSIS